MARKKKNNASALAVLPLAGLLAWAGWPSQLSQIIVGFIVFAGLLIVTIWTTSFLKYRRASKRVDSKLEEAVADKIEALVRRRAQLLQRDSYGNLKVEKWVREIDYFISKNVVPGLIDYDRRIAAARMFELRDYVEKIVAAETELEQLSDAFRDDMSPIDYEHYCAEELKLSGWHARVTMASRDQGVDVIAQKAGIRLVVQCKLYKSPVGNKAVQEIVAARAHETADYAIVVSNNSYTPAAVELARTNKIILLHHRDLVKIDNILSIAPSDRFAGSARLDLHSENASGCIASDEAFAETAGPEQSWRRLLYTAAATGFVIAAAVFFARSYGIHLDVGAVPNQEHTRQNSEVRRAPSPILPSETRATSSSDRIHAAVSGAAVEHPSSPSDAATQKPARSSLDRRTASAAKFSDDSRAAVERLEQPGPLPQTRKPESPVVNSPLALHCSPAVAGDTTSIEISIAGGNWTVLHRQKKGAGIERAEQYYIVDTSSAHERSWQGVHRRNRDLKMVAYLSRRSANGTHVYKEELIDANIGKVVAMTAVCEELRTSPTGARVR
ncbi:MAG TPA: restriction endonuclease [Methylocystis sp.]|jgi:hypothetical protein